MNIETVVGLAAAFFTTTSYIPQLLKVWRTGQADDLSLKMIVALATGLSLWVAYGIMRTDVAIIIANVTSVAFISFIAYFKLRQHR